MGRNFVIIVRSQHILVALLCLLLLAVGVNLLSQDDAQPVDYGPFQAAGEAALHEEAGILSGKAPAPASEADSNGDRTELDEDQVGNGRGPDRIPRPPVIIHGRVVNKFRAAVAGASIQITLGRPGGRGRRGQVRIKAPVVTNKDGVFEFEGEGFPDMVVGLEITHQDYALGLHRETFQGVDADGDVDLGEVEVVIGGSLTGAITDMTGVVLPGAEARLLPQDGMLRGLPNVRKVFPPIQANNSGLFRVDHIPPGQYRVMGIAPQRQRRYTDLITVSDAEEVVLDPIQLGPGFQVTGRIFKPEGGPVPKATVSLLATRGWRRPQRSQTDETGRFFFDHLAAGTYGLEVRAKGYLRHREGEIQVGSVPELNITLVHGLKVRGVVLDAHTNQPLMSYAARIRRVSDLVDPERERKRAEYQELRRQYEQRRRRMNSRQRRQMEQKLRQAALDADVRRQRRGQQRNPGGGRGGGRGGELPRDAGKPQAHPDGKFSFDGLEEGIYVVDFSAPIHQRIRSERIELQRGGVSPSLTLFMERGLLLAGRILDKQSGEPIQNARVDLLMVRQQDLTPDRGSRPNPWREARNRFRAPGPAGIPFLNTRTDKNGEFRMQQAGPGTYRLVARAEGHARGFTEAFEATGDLDDQELMLGRLGIIHGRVHALPPDKVDQARVIVSDLRRPRIVKVEPDSTYRIEDLQPGKYLVRAFIGSYGAYFRSSMRRFRAAGGNPAQLQPDVTIKEGSVVELALRIDQDPVGELAGQILVNGFGSGAKGFRVHLREINPMGPNAPSGRGPGSFRPNQASTTADQRGRYQLKEVMTGQYTMSIRAAGRGGAEVYRQVIHIHADRKNTQPAISLTLGHFTGTVAPEGASLAMGDPKVRRRLSGNVQLLPGITEMPKDWRQFRSENLVHGRPVRQGKFRFENLPLGDYLMVLRIRGFAPRIQPVYVDGSPVPREYQTGRRHRPKPKGKGKGKGKKPPGSKPKPGTNPKGASPKKGKPQGKPGR